MMYQARYLHQDQKYTYIHVSSWQPGMQQLPLFGTISIRRVLSTEHRSTSPHVTKRVLAPSSVLYIAPRRAVRSACGFEHYGIIGKLLNFIFAFIQLMRTMLGAQQVSPVKNMSRATWNGLACMQSRRKLAYAHLRFSGSHVLQ
jgi:hypothetical protein